MPITRYNVFKEMVTQLDSSRFSLLMPFGSYFSIYRRFDPKGMHTPVECTFQSFTDEERIEVAALVTSIAQRNGYFVVRNHDLELITGHQLKYNLLRAKAVT